MPLPNNWQFDAIGTVWRIDSLHRISQSDKLLVTELIERFDKQYSRFRDDSLVSRIASKQSSYEFDSSLGFSDLFRLYLDMYNVSSGAVTPLVGKTLANAGYDNTYKLKNPDYIEEVRALDDVIIWDDANTITVKEPVLLDFGAAGKGLLADLITDLLNSLSHNDVVVDASGDIVHRSATPYVIGLESPDKTSMVIGSIRIHNESLCSSATNRRSWDGFHHVIDGRSGVPTNNIAASWVLAGTGLLADGLATAMFFTKNPNALAKQYNAAYLRITQAGTIEMNELMKARVELFT